MWILPVCLNVNTLTLNMKHLANFLQNEIVRLEKLKEFDISSWKAPDLKEVESFFDRILKTLLTSLLFFLGTVGRWKFFECLLVTSLYKISLTTDPPKFF